MKHVLLVGLGVGLFAFGGCAASQSVWSRDPYVPVPQTIRGSQTYSPKTVVSPYQNNAGSVGGAGSGTTSGSGSK